MRDRHDEALMDKIVREKNRYSTNIEFKYRKPPYKE